MKAKKLEQDFEGRLQAATVSFKGEVSKLEKEMESRTTELLKACKTIDGLNRKLKKVQQKNKDIGAPSGEKYVGVCCLQAHR